MDLPSPKSTKKGKRLGRGYGTGVGGHTVGRGTKGQRSRSGYKRPGKLFEGGQNPITKRLPIAKGFMGSAGRGKHNRAYFRSQTDEVEIQLSRLETKVKSGDKVDMEKLIEIGLVKPKSHKQTVVKVLFDKDIKKKFTLEKIPASANAKKAIEKAGGTVSK